MREGFAETLREAVYIFGRDQDRALRVHQLRDRADCGGYHRAAARDGFYDDLRASFRVAWETEQIRRVKPSGIQLALVAWKVEAVSDSAYRGAGEHVIA